MNIRLTQFSIDLDYTDESLRRAVEAKLGVGVEGGAVFTVDVRRHSGLDLGEDRLAVVDAQVAASVADGSCGCVVGFGWCGY